MKKTKTMVINDKKYISIEEHEKLLQQAKVRVSGLKFKGKEIYPTSYAYFGVGSAELSGDWFKSTYSVDLLEKAIKVIKTLGEDKVDLLYTKDYPLILGKVKEGVASGVFLSPRVNLD